MNDRVRESRLTSDPTAQGTSPRQESRCGGGVSEATPARAVIQGAPIEVRVSYGLDAWPKMDDAIYAAAGRTSDFAGAGFGERDHGWICASEIEAQRISRALRAIGLTPVMKQGA